MRFLLLFSPLFLLHPISCIIQACFFTSSSIFLYVPHFFFVFWCAVVPVLYAAVIYKCFYNRINLEGGRMLIGTSFRDSFMVSDLVEVTGDQGTVANNYEESIVLRFNDDRELKIPINDYEEDGLRELIVRLREENPQATFSYTDVLPLESRGLLKFLHSTSESDSMIIKQSKTPIEDTMFQLMSEHERLFFMIYAGVWLVVVCGLAYYSAEAQLISATSSSAVMDRMVADASRELSRSLHGDAVGAQGWLHSLNVLVLQIKLLGAGALAYFSSQGVYILGIIWAFIGFVLAAVLPTWRKFSPTFVFVDKGSVGSGARFMTWDEVSQIELHKVGEFGDPLEGVLEIGQKGDEIYHERIKINLSRLPELQQRHNLLRMTERYGARAECNEEFMRATNVLTDIQFTDLWLEQQDADVRPVSISEGARSVGAGKYVVDKVIGYGGQGTTYLARRGEDSEDSAEKLVVKEIVLPSYADVRILQDARSRFERSARLLAGLEHPQIVKLIDYFCEEGNAYLVLEYVGGENLRKLVEKQGALDRSRVLELGAQLCEILSFLHDRPDPIIHCDLAPDNLILDESGKLKLLDFDVAHVLDSRTTGFVAARPSYTPPEQFRGNPTAASDIFALGAILHFLSKGSDPPPLGAGGDTESDGEGDNDLAALIAECGAFEENDRPPSAAVVLERLRALCAEEARIDV